MFMLACDIVVWALSDKAKNHRPVYMYPANKGNQAKVGPRTTVCSSTGAKVILRTFCLQCMGFFCRKASSVDMYARLLPTLSHFQNQYFMF